MQKILLTMVLGMVAAATAQIPAPLSFYDFEESEGTAVLDQGSAANHGEIVDNSGLLVRTTGGVFSKPTDGRGCIEFIEETAFGLLCYVRIPFKDFMNSPNYTYSAWIQYTGTPNWGYIFWADGETWEPDVTDRHVDVWLNPNNNGADCILNLEEGGQLRVATKANECGIELMNGDWHQVTVTLADGVSYKIYIDGQLCAEGEAASPVVQNSGDDLWLGARPNNADATTAVKIVGLMDRVRIWDTALDDKQVETLFNMEGPNGGTVAVKEGSNVPTSFRLLTNYPNPFNPRTTISFSLDRNESITVEICDLKGIPVRTLFHGAQAPGVHHLTWDGRNDAGESVASGVYLCRLSAGDLTDYRKLTLVK